MNYSMGANKISEGLLDLGDDSKKEKSEKLSYRRYIIESDIDFEKEPLLVVKHADFFQIMNSFKKHFEGWLKGREKIPYARYLDKKTADLVYKKVCHGKMRLKDVFDYKNNDLRDYFGYEGKILYVTPKKEFKRSNLVINIDPFFEELKSIDTKDNISGPMIVENKSFLDFFTKYFKRK